MKVVDTRVVKVAPRGIEPLFPEYKNNVNTPDLSVGQKITISD